MFKRFSAQCTYVAVYMTSVINSVIYFHACYDYCNNVKLNADICI